MAKQKNFIQEKSYEFALEIIKIYKFMRYSKREFVLCNQLLRSGTSIGANIEEAIGAESKKDFAHKMSISYKEAKETKYWLKLLRDSDYLSEENSQNLLADCEELCKILGKIISTLKKE